MSNMTLDEAIYCMKSYLPDDRIEHCTNCRFYGNTTRIVSDSNEILLCKSSEAHKLAIKALEFMKSICVPKNNKEPEKENCNGCKHLCYYNDGSAACDLGIDHACISSGFRFRESN